MRARFKLIARTGILHAKTLTSQNCKEIQTAQLDLFLRLGNMQKLTQTGSDDTTQKHRAKKSNMQKRLKFI